MRIVRPLTALLAVLAGCFSPALREGAPCENADQCPSPQRCVLGHCSRHDPPPIDASLPDEPDASVTIDAPPPPPIDAMPLACDTTGLACAGTATSFTCGGDCWVLCAGAAAPRETAHAACVGWMGELGQIDDATEQGCVRNHVNAAAWVGLVQPATATRPADGWTWNGTTPVVFTNWQSGVPDDRDNDENGAEQCAKIQTDGTWDDVTCSSPINFFCERP
jgi:Lectin C-type domain